MTAFEFWQVAAGDAIITPFWPWPVIVQGAEQIGDRFARVHWTGDGTSGVSRVSQHATVEFVYRWSDDTGRRYVPCPVPAADAAADSVRAQRLAGITGVHDPSATVAEWAIESDLAAMSRGEDRHQQPCGCLR